MYVHMELSEDEKEQHWLGLFVFISLFGVYRAVYFTFCFKKKKINMGCFENKQTVIKGIDG